MAEADPEGLDEVWGDWRAAVNMAPKELADWLGTDESKSVGDTGGAAAESTGHASGRRIVQILRTHKADLTADDVAHMRKVVGYVHRHTKQGGLEHDTAHSKWRYSLMNWGNDPLK
jgi:hypothetical protein